VIPLARRRLRARQVWTSPKCRRWNHWYVWRLGNAVGRRLSNTDG